MRLKRLVQRSIKKLWRKKVDGGVHIYILAMFFIVLLLVIVKLMISTEGLFITKYAVDDAIVESLISACTYNTTEYSISGATILYRNVTPFDYDSAFDDLTGGVIPTGTHDVMNDPEIVNPGADMYLNSAYAKFIQNLKQNLKLDDAMESSMSGISGPVSVTEFSVYNCYYNLDASGNKTDKRIVKYTRQASGSWSAHAYPINGTAEAYSSLDHTNVVISDTSVAATISFDVVKTTYSAWLMPGYTEDDMKSTVTYSRVVDITEN